MTHTLLGAAVALPIAVSHGPEIAVGCIWFGMVGGGLPDWIDLRSDLRAPLRLRHRGVSHSVFTLLASTAIFTGILITLRRAEFSLGALEFSVSDSTLLAWVACLALGCLSHLLSDACTISGIQPLLPFSKLRIWMLPRFLRTRSDGFLDTVVRWLSVIVLAFGVVLFAARWIAV